MTASVRPKNMYLFKTAHKEIQTSEHRWQHDDSSGAVVANHGNCCGAIDTMRKIAREAVIFMLLGPILVTPVVFFILEKDDVWTIRTRAALAVNAVDLSHKPRGYRAAYSVEVPLTDGVKLDVIDCNQVHPSNSTETDKIEMAGVVASDWCGSR